ncbi:uncharacterized protein AB675_4057 [Cyphellophora attinorum]|uniref:CENP-V/GFA domain-containing protein n=1 Tax=Cyphellophora attinorum TaxID=1664694 RepID=A0A0N1NVB4_9EURO|nr:uncharacterized protein AB675_4057 [Phialophora attinorum]KPI34467.1 hypothetical protein AB675_4057 [Phialophora attinorum]
MPTGSCFCEKVKIEYSGEPAMTALCHCADCRKISGGLYSHNIVVPVSAFNITSGKSTLKEISKTADSGKSITSAFCTDCGTTVFRYGDSFGGPDGMRIIKAGVLDDVDVLNNTKPGAELYASERISWVQKVGGSEDKKGME